MNAKAALAVLVANALVSAALVLGHAAWISPPRAPRLAVLDVAELYRLKEKQITAVLTRLDATDEERAGALKGAGAFGTELTMTLQALHEECRCLILARGAVIGEPQALPDLTPDVRRRLGL
jgi:hypothetical protein